MSRFTVYLTHHSHCDLGYTHDMPIVYELQRRYIDEALDLADRYADLGEESTFRWTCEVTSVVEHWMQTASPRQMKRFVAACRRGQIEVCALWGNLTPLATQGQLVELLTPLRRLRDETGLKVRAAMNSDVNGFSWALAGLLAASGIEGLTMSINEHFGGAPQPFPGLFRWRTPQGGFLPVWSGPTYAHTAWLGLSGPADQAFTKLSAMVARHRAGGQSRPWLAMQITHAGPQNDNMGPIAHLSPWIRQFNKAYGEQIRLVLTTPSRLFDAIRPDVAKAEIIDGEWNDWWNFGCGSTPFETALFRRATARLEEADFLSLIKTPRNFSCLRTRATDGAAHYLEHTWGADVSVHRFEEEDARIQSRHKEKFAYDAFSLSRLLRRDGLSALADRIEAPAGPVLMVFNPSPYPRHEIVQVPRRFLAATNLPPDSKENPAGQRWPRDGAYQHFVDRDLFGGLPVDEVGPFALAPYSWTVISPDQLAQPAKNLVTTASSVSNGRTTFTWKPGEFGLSKLTAGGRQWIAGNLFGTVIAEKILGERGEIMRFDDSSMPTTSRLPVWNENPPLEHSLPTKVGCTVVPGARFVDVIQTGKLPSTDGVTVRWRIFADQDDLEVEISLRQLPDALPHSYYFALPFKVAKAQRLVATSGLAVNPDTEAVSNGCRWWSAQEGFVVGDDISSAYVATPETPMIGFRQLPFGPAKTGKVPLKGDGVSWVWLANNYWETNFKADASGLLRLRFRLSFAPGRPAAQELARLGSVTRHPLACHPLPERGRVSTPLPSTGTLLEIVSQHAFLESWIAEPETETVRVILTNPSNSRAAISLREKSLRLLRAEQLDAEGRPIAKLPLKKGVLKATVPPRSSLFIRLKASIA